MTQKFVVYGALLFLAAGCQSFTRVVQPFTSLKPDYTDLPVEDLRTLAMDVEREIAVGNRAPDIDGHGPLTLDDPAIAQAIRTRAARYELIDAFRSTGFGWEKKDSLISVIRSSAYKKSGTRRSRDRDAMLVMSENDNRWIIYEQLLKVNNLP
ncbi:MAG TPA: hypothetical protein QF901_10950, partial [Gammaproteobacteria bacterium]|nr:hypothetical protein [Gammaproteobacteria bacterium]